MPSAIEIIKKLNLQPLPFEGGFYRETYRSDALEIPARQIGIASDSTRQLFTAYYYLVTSISFAEFHRVRSDDLFHFYAGDAAELVQISAQGQLTTTIIGNQLLDGEQPQVLVPKNAWRTLRVRPGGSWVLLGATLAPGFEFEDFEIASRAELLRCYPQFTQEIVQFTKDASR